MVSRTADLRNIVLRTAFLPTVFRLSKYWAMGAETREGPIIVVLFYVLFVLCRSVYLCVNVYCTTATGRQPNCI